MNCPHCNTELSKDFSFCINCGAPVDSDATVMLPNNHQNAIQSITPSQTTEVPSTFNDLPPKKKGKSNTVLIIIIVFLILLIGSVAAIIVMDYTDTIDFIDFLPLEESDDDENDDDENEDDQKNNDNDSNISEDKDNNDNDDKKPEQPSGDHEEDTSSHASLDIPAEMISDPKEYFSDSPTLYFYAYDDKDIIPVYSSCNKDSDIVGSMDSDFCLIAIGKWNGWICFEYGERNCFAWAEEKFFGQCDDLFAYVPTKADTDAISGFSSSEGKYMYISYPDEDYEYYIKDKHSNIGFTGHEVKDGQKVWVYGFDRVGYAYMKYEEAGNEYYGWGLARYLTTEAPEMPSVSDSHSIIAYFNDQEDAYYRVYDAGLSGLNLRTENNTDCEVIKVLQESEIVLVYGIEDGWAFVKTDDPRTESDLYGWCSAEFLTYHSAY